MPVRSVIKYWDEFWRNHPEYAVKNIHPKKDGVSQLLIHAIDSNPLLNGASLIEIGSGPGTRSIPIAKQKNLELTLLDLSQPALDLANQRAQIYGISVRLELQDMLNTGLPDDSFDIVYGYGPHDHFFGEDRQKIFDEMYKITKPGGIVVSILPSKLNPFWSLEKIIKQRNGTWEFGPTEFFTPCELVRRTESAGYRGIELLGASFYTSWLRVLPRSIVNRYRLFDNPTPFGRLNDWLHTINMRFSNPLNKYFGGDIMVVGKKPKKGVAVIITDPDREVFYIQQKDEDYPIPDHRNQYAFFGGEIEKGEDEVSALERELREELGPDIVSLVKSKLEHFKIFEIDSPYLSYDYSVYELVLPKEEIERISEYEVREGRGSLVNRNQIIDLPFILDSKPVLLDYLRAH